MITGSSPAQKKTTLITFLPGYQRRFPAKRETQTQTETQLIDRLDRTDSKCSIATFQVSQVASFLLDSKCPSANNGLGTNKLATCIRDNCSPRMQSCLKNLKIGF